MKNKSGVSLIELLISISLMGLVLIVFTSASSMGSRVFNREFRHTTLQNDNRIVLDRIVSDAKQAIKVDASSTATMLIMETPSIDAAGDILYDVTGQFKTDVFTYSLAGSILTKQVAPDASSARIAETKDILTNVSNLNFSYIPDVSSADQVQINLVNQDSINGKVFTVNNTSKALLRNK